MNRRTYYAMQHRRERFQRRQHVLPLIDNTKVFARVPSLTFRWNLQGLGGRLKGMKHPMASALVIMAMVATGCGAEMLVEGPATTLPPASGAVVVGWDESVTVQQGDVVRVPWSSLDVTVLEVNDSRARQLLTTVLRACGRATLSPPCGLRATVVPRSSGSSKGSWMKGSRSMARVRPPRLIW